MINTGMDSDAGGSDTVAASPGEAVTAAMALCVERESDVQAQGSTVGDLMAGD